MKIVKLTKLRPNCKTRESLSQLKLNEKLVRITDEMGVSAEYVLLPKHKLRRLASELIERGSANQSLANESNKVAARPKSSSRMNRGACTTKQTKEALNERIETLTYELSKLKQTQRAMEMNIKNHQAEKMELHRLLDLSKRACEHERMDRATNYFPSNLSPSAFDLGVQPGSRVKKIQGGSAGAI